MKLLEYDRHAREQRRVLREHYARFDRLRELEFTAGLRVIDAPGLTPRRLDHAIGERVLRAYPPREGTVINYEQSDKTNGDTNGGECLVRYDNGYEVLGLVEEFVALDLPDLDPR